jgi:hypothetical protein
MSYFYKIIRAAVRFPYRIYFFFWRPFAKWLAGLGAVPFLRDVGLVVRDHWVWLNYMRQVDERKDCVTRIALEWPLSPQVRYGHGLRRNEAIGESLDRSRPNCLKELALIRSFQNDFLKIPLREKSGGNAAEPWWVNGMLPGMDAAALYSFLSSRDPRFYMEIGSGHSTRFANRAVADHRLSTKMISIDPDPRSAIDGLCDEVIRKPLENIELDLFKRLGSGDILFVDSSHRCFQNSDVTVLFLEVIPRLEKGVLIHFHDIYWPEDYPPEWKGRFYNEQYLLGVFLLAGSGPCEILLPNRYVFITPELRKEADLIWHNPYFEGVESGGSSFWIRKL